LQGYQHALENVIHIGQHIIVPKAQNPKAPRFQEFATDFIIRSSPSMLSAIQFDNEIALKTDKIRDISSDQELTLESVSA
jgi:hypothetical protein